MPKKKIAYYYDTETCTYHRAKVDSKVVLRRVAGFLVVGIVVAFVTTKAFSVFFRDSHTARLAAEQDTLYSKIDAIHDKLDTHEEELGELLDKENELYLPIVGSAQIPTSSWQASAGGQRLFDPSRNDKATEVYVRLEKMRHQTQVLRSSYESVEKKMMTMEEEMKNVPSILPVNARLISGFGNRRHPITGAFKFHTGLDFDCDVGTALYATADGIVTNSGYGESGYGLYIDIDHQNGYTTKFAHMSSSKVRVGQKVTRGQLIGYSGNTGLSSGPHLHYEIIYKGTKIDPIDFFYMDLSPQEYRRLSLDPSNVTKEAVKKKLDAPAMD